MVKIFTLKKKKVGLNAKELVHGQRGEGLNQSK